MAKKIFIISLVFFLVMGIFLLVQFFLFSNKSDSKKSISNSQEVDNDRLLSEDINKSEKGKIEKIINAETKGLWLINGELSYFNQNNFLSASLDGSNKNSLATYPFNSVTELSWSFDDKNVIVRDSGKYYIFNFEKKEAVPFKSDADNLIWGNIGNQVVYKYYDLGTKKRSLNVSDLSGEKWQEITEIPFQFADVKMNPKKEVVALFSKPDSSQETQLFIVDLVKKEKKEVSKKYKGANFEWSPDGTKLLFSYTKDNGKTNLAVMTVENETVLELNFPGLVDKCVWSNDSESIYCANPTFIDSGVVLPDDWSSEKSFSTDTFWQINTATGEQNRVIELNEINEDIDAKNLLLDKNEDYLFFIDRKTEDVFRIRLN